MLTLTRTANAGVLLELSGKKILLDGVSRQVGSFLQTPEHIKNQLQNSYPDLVAVTHRHQDHCDPDFERLYTEETGRPVIGPSHAGKAFSCGDVTVHVVHSRHIGRHDCRHVSYILQGSACVWFVGDASPSQWNRRTDLPKPDVLIVPFAYAATPSAWRQTCQLGAKSVVLIHMPDRDNDPLGIWEAVEATVGDGEIFIPKVEEFVRIAF